MIQSILMITADQLLKIVFGIWILTTANTNTGFEARRLLTQANNNNGGGGAKDVSIIVPLNRYSLFEELEDKILVSMQLQFNIELNNDDELIHC